MSFDEWVLALHVLSAFAYISGVVLFWVLIVAVRRADSPEETIRLEPVVKVGNAAIGIGAGGTILLRDLARVLVRGLRHLGRLDHRGARALGGRGRARLAYRRRVHAGHEQGAGSSRRPARRGPNAELLALNRTQSGVLLHALASVVVLLIVVDMIWKPGA